MKSKLRNALDSTSPEFSPDRVVADPDLNAAFLAECVRIGLVGSPATLNRALLNLRKQGELRDRKSRKTSFANEDEYRFAAEMAVRFLERRDGLSLDAIICDPAMAAEFDGLASKILPGYSPLQYRWAALNLRKMKQLQPELLATVVRPLRVATWSVEEVDLSAIPMSQGLYLFFTTTEVLYVGETLNLRDRLEKHLDHSDNKGLARWMWDYGTEHLHLEIQVFEPSTTTRTRRALEMELIRSRRPVFNVKV